MNRRILVRTDIGDDRGMVAWQLALSGVSVNHDSRCSRADRIGRKDQIDAHSATHVKVAFPIVPPAVEARPVVVVAEYVVESPCIEGCETLSFGLGNVCYADVGFGVVGTKQFTRSCSGSPILI